MKEWVSDPKHHAQDHCLPNISIISLVIEEQQSQAKKSSHHGEGASIIWEGCRDEAFIFIVLEGTHRSLLADKEMRIPRPLVVHHKFEDAIHIRDCQPGRECALHKQPSKQHTQQESSSNAEQASASSWPT